MTWVRVPDGAGGWRDVDESDPSYQMFAEWEQQAQAAKANFEADIANWATMTDAQKLSHVLGLMQFAVGAIDFLSGGAI